MMSEKKKEKGLFKKVCSETSFQGCEERNRDSQKQQILPVLNLLEKKTSKSLNDLCRQVGCDNHSPKRNDTFLSPERDKHINYSVVSADGFNNNNKIAGRCIVNLLMLNAWRRQKASFKIAQGKIESLNSKVEGFEMQVYVLRQLLNAEKKRVEVTNENIQDLLHRIEQCNEEKTLIVKEKENLEKKCSHMSNYCSRIENDLRNKESYIITCRFEIESWEKRLKNEREKVEFNKNMLILKTLKIEELREANKELQHKLDVQVPSWEETMAQVDLANAQLKEAEARKVDLEKILEEKEKQIKELKSSIVWLERRLQEEDENNGLLAKSVLEKSNELSIIQTKLLELSKNSYPWSGGIIKAASFCAKIPVACICTVGSLLWPFPSYRL